MAVTIQCVGSNPSKSGICYIWSSIRPILICTTQDARHGLERWKSLTISMLGTELHLSACCVLSWFCDFTKMPRSTYRFMSAVCGIRSCSYRHSRPKVHNFPLGFASKETFFAYIITVGITCSKYSLRLQSSDRRSCCSFAQNRLPRKENR